MLTVEEAARALGCPEQDVEEMVKRKELPAIDISCKGVNRRTLRIFQPAVIAQLENNIMKGKDKRFAGHVPG